MATAKEMTLLMRIRAEGAQAMAVMRGIGVGVTGIANAAALTGRTVGSTFRVMSSVAGAVFAPLRYAGIAALGLGGAFAAIAAKSLSAAGDVETLQMRLEGVTGSAETAKRLFEETSRMAGPTPFGADELIEARILLEGLGVSGAKALTSIIDAASIMGRQVPDVASILGSMETEPLRRMGIMLKTEGEKFEFEFRDRVGKTVKLAVEGRGKAQQELLKIFDLKFGGSAAKFAASWQGNMSTLKQMINRTFASFGKGLEPAAIGFVSAINAGLEKTIASGKLQEWGTAIADKIVVAFDYVRAVAEYLKGVFDGLQKTDQWGAAFKTIALAFAESVSVSLVTYLRAMGHVFIGLGKLISGAFLEDVLRLPGMGQMRDRVAGKAAFDLSNQGQRDKLKAIDPNYQKYVLDRIAGGETTANAFDLWARNLDPEKQMQLISATAQSSFESGIQEFTTQIPALGKELGGALTEIWTKAMGDLRTESGYTGPGVEQLAKQHKDDREKATAEAKAKTAAEKTAAETKALEERAASTALYRVSVPVLAREERTKTGVRRYFRNDEFRHTGAIGAHKLGDRFMGGVVISINKLEARGNRPLEIQNDIMRKAVRPLWHPAGG